MTAPSSPDWRPTYPVCQNTLALTLATPKKHVPLRHTKKALRRPKENSMTTIRLDDNTQAFYKGASVGRRVRDLLTEGGGDTLDHDTQLAFFYTYVGAEMKDIEGEGPQAQFLAGAGTQAPQRHNEFVVRIDTSVSVLAQAEDLGYTLGLVLATFVGNEGPEAAVERFDNSDDLYFKNVKVGTATFHGE